GSRLERNLLVAVRRSAAEPSPSLSAAPTPPGSAAAPSSAVPPKTTPRRSGHSGPVLDPDRDLGMGVSFVRFPYFSPYVAREMSGTGMPSSIALQRMSSALAFASAASSTSST